MFPLPVVTSEVEFAVEVIVAPLEFQLPSSKIPISMERAVKVRVVAAVFLSSANVKSFSTQVVGHFCCQWKSQ